MFFVYVLYSDEFDRHYVGMSEDFNRRLNEHNSRKVRSTKAFVPLRMIYVQEFNTRAEARWREKYLKTAAGRRWRKNNLGH